MIDNNWEKIKDIFSTIVREYCYCWSWKKYKSCCKNYPSKPLISVADNEKSKIIFNKAWFLPTWTLLKMFEKTSEKKCLFEWCNNNAINSHLISKNILKKISQDGLYKGLQFNDSGEVTLKNIWINKIKTFLWWCNYHDSNIFKSIDENIFDCSEKHIFLYVLRALWYEKRVKNNALKLAYSLFYHNLEKESVFLNFLWTYHWFLDINKRYNIMETYYKKLNFNRLKNISYKVKDIKYPIFVSSVFHLRYDLEINLINDIDDLSKECFPIIFNIITTDNDINIIFSFINKDFYVYERFLKQLNYYYNNNYDIFINVINNLIDDYCENIIVWWSFEEPTKHKFYINEVLYDLKVNPTIKYIY